MNCVFGAVTGGGIRFLDFAQRVQLLLERAMIEAVVGSTVDRVDQARRKMASAGHEEVEEDNVSEAAVPSFQKLASGGKLLDPALALRLVGADLEKAAVDSTLETPVQGFQK